MDELEMIEQLKRQIIMEEKAEPTVAELAAKADGGDFETAWKLCRMFTRGDETDRIEKDEKKADYWYEKAIAILTARMDGGDGISAAELVEICRHSVYRSVRIKERERTLAVDFYYKSEMLLSKQIAEGNIEARQKLSHLYCLGIRKAIEPQIDKAIALWQEAADGGDAAAIWEIGLIYLSYGEGSYREKIEAANAWFKKAASVGNKKAMYQLGVSYIDYDYYDNIIGTEVKKAIPWLVKAAESGSADAMRDLAAIYQFGCKESKIRKDYAKAIYWHKQFLAQPDGYHWQRKNNLVNLAFCYCLGKGEASNHEVALKMFEALISWDKNNDYYKERDNELYCGMLGYMYMEGRGTQRDYDKAFYYTSLAADNGDGPGFAVLNLAEAYEKGRGVKKDINRAIELYKVAMPKRKKEAEKELLRLVRKGKVTKREFFECLVQTGLKKIETADYGEAEKRAEYECGIIEKYNLYDYFLMWYDIASFAKENEIPIGLGRGAAAGSIVCYALGITQIDPTKFGLSSELFLSDEKHASNICIDISYKQRERITVYVTKKYGAEMAAKVKKYGYKVLDDINDTIELIRHEYGITVDTDDIRIEKKVLEMLGEGDTNGVFQFESEGMKKLLRELKPQNIDDLVAAIALYRPGYGDELSQYMIDRKYPDSALKIRAHCTAYALLAYQTAYLKCEYPKEYATACKNNGTDD